MQSVFTLAVNGVLIGKGVNVSVQQNAQLDGSRISFVLLPSYAIGHEIAQANGAFIG
jgi:hypothetical protein